MKAKYALVALLAVTFFGCDDNTAGLGLGMFPGSDQNINGKLSTFGVTTTSIATGQIYAKTNIGYVGKFTDDTFGTYNAGFLATLNCPEGLTFPDVYKEAADGKSATGVVVTDETDKDIEVIKDANGNPIGNIRTVELYMWYDSYFGDSLTACRLSVYELNKKLDPKDAYYTNIVPDEYYIGEGGATKLLGTKAYTAVDLSVKDSIRNSDNYVPSVYINFEKSVANRVGGNILKAAKAAGSNFGKDLFITAFPGLYVKSDYGDGTVLYVFQSQMNVVFKCYAVDEKTGLKLKKKYETNVDSTYYTTREFYSTREVIQANQLTNDPVKIKELINQPKNTYIKSPAGIFTQAELPISEISQQLKQDTLNAVKLTFSNYNQLSDKKFGMSIPSNVLLVRKKYKDSFFEKNQLSDGITSSTAKHIASSNQYVFSNITNLVNDCLSDGEWEAADKILNKPGGGVITLTLTDAFGKSYTKDVTTMKDWEKYSDWNKFVLIPILVTYDSNNQAISMQHDLKPGYVRLKGGSAGETEDEYKLKLEVISTNFGTTKSN